MEGVWSWSVDTGDTLLGVVQVVDFRQMHFAVFRPKSGQGGPEKRVRAGRGHGMAAMRSIHCGLERSIARWPAGISETLLVADRAR